MNIKKNIWIAFILNLSFSVFEFIGGIVTGSVAILSDSIHDVGDAMSIGVSLFLENKSKKKPDEKYTYGYLRYSVIGSLISNLILLLGSLTVIYRAILKIINPEEIDYRGMIVFAIVGVCVNFGAAFITRKGESLNQKAINLHMLEDVLGWFVVLVGALVMSLTDLYIIDPLMSIGVAMFILISALKNLREVFDVCLEKTPNNLHLGEIKKHLLEIDGVIDVHHIHVWSIDGQNNYATMHIVSDSDWYILKEKIRDELREHGIVHTTLELEAIGEHCPEKECHIDLTSSGHLHHHSHCHDSKL